MSRSPIAIDICRKYIAGRAQHLAIEVRYVASFLKVGARLIQKNLDKKKKGYISKILIHGGGGGGE